MRRPALTDATLLAHIFSPKKNPKPTGLRHRKLKGAKGQRVARINAYNKMPAEKQAIIDRSGQREKYLRGEVTFTDTKRTLRDLGVRLGVVKPLRPRMPPITTKQRFYDDAVIEHLKDEGLDESRHWNERNTRIRLANTNRVDKRKILFATKAEIRRKAARQPQPEDEYDFNPWWYH